MAGISQRSNGDEAAIDRLQKVAAPELNYLLTEPPFQINGEVDFGWYCREHAFCTQTVAALLGLECNVVTGDFLVVVPGSKRLSSIGTGAGHFWCTSATAPVLDLSLHFREFGPGPQLDEPIVNLGRNGIFDVRILPENTSAVTVFETPIIGYIPRQTLKCSATELISEPTLLLPTREAAEISARVALHTFGILSGERGSLAALLHQADALAGLRATYPNPLNRLRELMNH